MICANCAQPGHSHTPDSPCHQTTKCPNCSGPHPSYSNECPTWMKEKEVARVKTTLNLTYPVARKRVAETSTLPQTMSSLFIIQVSK